MTRTAIAAILLLTAGAGAQSPIQWNGNARAAIDRAHEQGLPLMFWVTESNDPGDDNDLEDAQNDSFRDPIVVAIAHKYYIPVRVSRNSRVLEEAQKLGLPTSHGLYVAIITSDGKLLDQIDPGQVADPMQFAERLTAASRQYRDQMYQQNLREHVANLAAPKPEVRRALQTVWRLGILSADTDIVAILDRTDLLPGERKRLYDVLASFATAPCVEALLTRAAAGEKDAITALNKAEPGALEFLRADIPAPDAAELSPRQIAACRAASQIARLPSRPPDTVWAGPATPARTKALEKLAPRVDSVFEYWQENTGRWR